MKRTFFLLICVLLLRPLTAQDTHSNAPQPDRPLTEDERIYGLTQFWTEVKYNFAFFDKVPELNWDAQLLEYLPKVRAAASDAEYYRLLERLCASLRDGHTNVYPPAPVQAAYSAPRIQLEYIDGQAVVVNADSALVAEVPLGTIITAVAGVPVDDYRRERVEPYVASSGKVMRETMATYQLLQGPVEEPVRFVIRTPEGEKRSLSLSRGEEERYRGWYKDRSWGPMTTFRMLDGGTGYLALNTFAREEVVDSFLNYLPEIANCRSLVIDLRKNGGGNSDIGYEVLKRLADRPLPTSTWRTREHRPAYKAWGSWMQDMDVATASPEERAMILTYRGENWYYGKPDTLTPHDTAYTIPVVVLVSRHTASAAEDFLVAADPLPHFTYIGEPSFGSTGQPLFLDLPGGGTARICTKRDTYADGREFVGPGVQVDVVVQPTVEEFLRGEDLVLNRAVALLGAQ